MEKFLLAMSILLAVVILGVPQYNRWRAEVFREGYERGAVHTAAYLKRYGELPSKAWRDKAWRFTNSDLSDVRWVEGITKEVEQ